MLEVAAMANKGQIIFLQLCLYFCCVFSLQPGEKYVGNTIRHILNKMETFNSQQNFSRDCFRELRQFADALNQSLWLNYTGGDPFSFLMEDAWGKPESGYLDGNSVWEGSYLQCIRARDDYLDTGITGKMCITEWKRGQMVDGIGTCVPSSCSEHDVQILIRQGFDGLDGSDLPPGFEDRINSSETFCVTHIGDKEITKDTSAMAAISVLSFFVLLGIIGTIYDLATMKRRRATESLNKPVRRVYPEYRIPRPNVSSSSSSNLDANWSMQYENRAYDSKPELPPPSSMPQGFVSYPPPDYTENEYAYERNWYRAPVTIEAVPRMPQDTQDIEDSKEVWEPDTCGKICLAFSIRPNAMKILGLEPGPGNIRVLNGIRFVAFAWIVLGHTWTLGVTESNAPTIANKHALKRLGPGYRATQFVIEKFSYSAETFFILTAVLVTISLLKKLRQSEADCELVGTYFFHRFWRLTPIYMFVLMAYGCLFKYVGSGPFYRYPEVITDSYNCKKYFWKHLIYLNNLIEVEDGSECMSWTWYLANDFQFYVISPAFIFSLYYVPVFGIVFTVLAFCGGMVANIYLQHQVRFSEVAPGVPAVDEYFDIAIKPWCRCTTYFMGVLLGYVLWKNKFKVKMNKGGVAMAWLLFLALSCTLMYAEWNWRCQGCNDWPDRAHVAFKALDRTLFGLVVCWIIFACATGYGGFINSILSWKGWLPLSRLTYAGYLFHPIFIYYYYYQRPVQLYITDIDMVLLYCGILVLSLGASFLLSLFLEMPLLALEKVMFAKTLRNKHKN